MVSNLTLKIGADIAGLQKDLNKATGQLDGFNKHITSVGKMIAGAFAVSSLANFGKEVFNITAEFQKFEAVLTNTLGDKGAAQAAMRQITEFASSTPFQVNELTGSFVKLANQGFIPTMQQMKKLGDVAASTGKGFDQLTEGIIDAQTGEFERLKDFGIRASKEGDRVTFTFKGVKTQVDFTADSIREYILSLGELQGVSGATDAISKTLGGTLSNLSDAWDQLKVSIGNLVEGDGMVSSFLNNLAAGAKAIANALGGPTREELIRTRDLLAQIRAKAWAEKDMATWDRARAAWQEADERLRAMTEGEAKLAEIQNNKTIPAVKEQTRSLAELVAEWDRLNHVRESSIGIADKDDAFGEIMNSVADKKSASTFVLQAERLSNTLKAMGQGLKINSQEWAEWEAGVNVRMQKVAEKIEIDFAPMIHSALSGIGQALGSAINGSANLGKSLLKVLGGVLIQLGEMLLSVGIGIAGFKKALTSLNPAIAIGAGVALIALGTAVAGSMKSLGSSSGSSHSSAASTGARGGSSRGGLDSGGIQIEVGGEFRIQGPDLVYIFNRQQQLNGRTRG